MAALTGLSPSTIAARVESLLSAGYLLEDGEQSGRGRKPRTLSVNADLGVVAAVDIGSRHTRIGFTDLAGTLLGVVEYSAPDRGDAATYLEWLTQRIQSGAAALDHPSHRALRGIGVSIASPVDRTTGKLIHPMHLPGWNSIDPAQTLSSAFGVPVVVDNDATVMALGEHRMHYPRVANMLYIKLGSAIGCGIVIGGELYGGRSGGAGEIGHIPVDAPNYRRRCQCGRDTCLEACFGGAAISEHLAIRGQGSEGDADFAALAAARNPVAIEVLRDAGTHIGDAIGTLCNVFNPELVVIGGKLSQVEQLTHALRASLYARALPLNARDLEVVVSKNAADASILGAAWQVIDLVLSTELVNQDLADYAETFDSTSSSTRRIDWSTAPASTASSPSAEIRISGG